MFNPQALREKRLEKRIKVTDLCEELDICETTYYRKVKRGGDFSRAELCQTANLLGLTFSELCDVFFAKTAS